MITFLAPLRTKYGCSENSPCRKYGKRVMVVRRAGFGLRDRLLVTWQCERDKRGWGRWRRDSRIGRNARKGRLASRKPRELRRPDWSGSQVRTWSRAGRRGSRREGCREANPITVRHRELRLAPLH